MKGIIYLDDNDLDVIAREIASQHDDTTSVYIDINGYELNVLYDKETTCSREDDYFTGTGAYNVSCSYLSINDIQAENDELVVVYDENLLYKKTLDFITY